MFSSACPAALTRARGRHLLQAVARPLVALHELMLDLPGLLEIFQGEIGHRLEVALLVFQIIERWLALDGFAGNGLILLRARWRSDVLGRQRHAPSNHKPEYQPEVGSMSGTMYPREQFCASPTMGTWCPHRVCISRGCEQYRKTISPISWPTWSAGVVLVSLGAVLRGAKIEKMIATSPCGASYQSNSTGQRNKAGTSGKPTRKGGSWQTQSVSFARRPCLPRSFPRSAWEGTEWLSGKSPGFFGHRSPTRKRGFHFPRSFAHIPRLRVGLLWRFAAKNFPNSL